MSTNLKHLKEVQYKDLTKLNKRWKTYEYMNPFFDIYDIAIKKLNLSGDENILEVGCADGKVLENLYKSGHKGKLIGLDIHKFNKKEKGVKFVSGNAQKLKYKDDSLDVILSFFMIYHMENSEAAIKEWLRVLKKGGRIVITSGTGKNKSKMRTIKHEAAEIMNKKINHITGNCNFNKLISIIKNIPDIKCVYKKVHKSNIHISDIKILLNGVDSTRDTFRPFSNNNEWKQILKYIKDKIEDEIKEKGIFVDNVDRGVLIIEKVG